MDCAGVLGVVVGEYCVQKKVSVSALAEERNLKLLAWSAMSIITSQH